MVITEDMLRKVAESYAKSGIDEPKISIKVSFQNLKKTRDYENIKTLELIGLCDTVTVIIEKLGIEVKAKIVKYAYDSIRERFDSVEIGEAKTNLIKQMTASQKEQKYELTKTVVQSDTFKKQTEQVAKSKAEEMVVEETTRAEKVEEELKRSIAECLTEEEATELIGAKASSIRLKGGTIKWEATNSTMTEDGTLTCRSGTYISSNGTRSVNVANGELQLKYKDSICGEITGKQHSSDQQPELNIITKRYLSFGTDTNDYYRLDTESSDTDCDSARHSFEGIVKMEKEMYCKDGYKEIDGQYYQFQTSYPSDQRLKRNVKDTQLQILDEIDKIRFVAFDWKRNGEHENIGIIADELEQILPDAIEIAKQPEKNEIQDIKTINIQKMTVYALKAIQELKRKME